MSMVSDFGNLSCTLEEEHYLTLVEKDLASFSRGRSVRRVLVFPPLPARFRFLTHKLIEKWPKLESCSVGSEPSRRTVVYIQENKAEISKRTQKSMSTLKQETQHSTSGSGRGQAVRGRGQHFSQRNSPTSRRPAQALYTPGAFNKQRKNTDHETARSVESPGNVRGNTRKSIRDIKPLEENYEIGIKSSQQGDKSDLADQMDCKYESKNKNKTRKVTEDTNSIECSLNKLHVSSPTRYSVQDDNERNKGHLTACTSSNNDYTDVMFHEGQLSCIDSTCSNVTESLPSNDSAEQLIHDYCGNIVWNKLDDESHSKQEMHPASPTLFENTSNDGNIETRNRGKTACFESTKKLVEVNLPTVDCQEFASNFAEQIEVRSCSKEKSVSENTTEMKNDVKRTERSPKAEIDKAIDYSFELCESNVTIMTDVKPFSNMDQESSVKSSNDTILSTKSSDVLRKEASEPGKTFNDEDNKIEAGNNEGIVDIVNKEKSEVQSKSKRQCKKEMRAKKREEKVKKKQVTPKSEKTKTKCDGEEKTAGGEDKEDDLRKKGNSNKPLKIEQEKKDMIRDNQVKKTDDKCKDPLPGGHNVNKEVTAGELENEKDSAEGEDWETAWDDDGECLNADQMAELNEQLDTTNLQIVKPQFDYLSFKPNDIVLENGVYDHVLELYDFSPEFKDRDLLSCLSNSREQGVKIHWVDDTHALAVFSSHRTARQAIEQCSGPMLKLRPLYDGTQKSKLQARRKVDDLKPYKERPKTTKLIANRLVTGALGMRSKMSPEERQQEREKIKSERERKKNKEKQKKDLWESDDL